jgi:hypothetical protein
MSFDPISAAFDVGKTLIDKIWVDANKREEEHRKLEELRQSGDLAQLNAHVQLMLSQIKVNQVAASHKSVFVAGARPFIMWMCGVSLGMSYLVPLVLEWVVYFMCESECVVPARLNTSELAPILLGLLGLGSMRSFDKTKNTQTDRIK